MKSRTYDLGPAPRPPVVQFVYADGRRSAVYALEHQLLEVPEDVLAVEIRHLPVYPADYPQADEPGWGHVDDVAADARPGEGAAARVRVRSREHFQRGSAG